MSDVLPVKPDRHWHETVVTFELLNIVIHIPLLRHGFADEHRSIRCVQKVPVHIGGQIHDTIFRPLKAHVPPFWHKVLEHGPMKFSHR